MQVDGAAGDAHAMTNSIRPQVDASLLIEGDVEVIAADGSLVGRDSKMWLCRCGQSGNKPFCDGAHRQAGFADAGRVPADYVMKRPQVVEPPACLRLTLRTNGPINCLGQTRIVGEDGSSWQGEQANLCRCGKSNIKPFCDGSHRAADFIS